MLRRALTPLALASAVTSSLVAVGCAAVLGIEDFDGDGRADGGVPLDAGDAGDARQDDAAMDGGVAFCATASAPFCADFEQGGVGDGWSRVVQTGGGVLSFAPREPGSTRRALVASLPPVAGSGEARLFRTTTGALPYEIALELDVRRRDAAEAIVVASIELGAPPRAHRLALQLQDGAAALLEITGDGDGGSPTRALPLTVAPPTDRWARVRIEARYSQPSPEVSVAVDGVTALPPTRITPVFGEPRVDVGVGAARTQTNDAHEVMIDDVTLVIR